MKKLFISLFTLMGGCLIGGISVARLVEKNNKEKRGDVEKFKKYYNMLNQWFVLKQEKKEINNYFVKNGYKSIAIYGMGEMGNRLYDELRNSNTEVKYAIDQNSANIYSELKIIDKNDSLEEVDAIVVTAIFAYEEIARDLEGRTNADIISLEDIIYEL